MWAVVVMLGIVGVLVVYGLVTDLRMRRVRRNLSADERAQSRQRLAGEIAARDARVAALLHSRFGRFSRMAVWFRFLDGLFGGPRV